MKKILFIDTESLLGHVAFNSEWLLQLSKVQNVCIHVVGRSGYFDKIKPKEVTHVTAIPHVLFLSKDRGKFINRLLMWLRCIYVVIINRCSAYDYVIFSIYDDIVLFFTPIRHRVFLVEHNLAKLDNSVKLFFFRQLSKHCQHIVFNEYIARRIIDLGIACPVIVQHGLAAPFLPQPHVVLSTINNRFLQDDFAKILFCPSAGSSDTVFLNRLVADERFLDFIEKNHILFVMKRSRPLHFDASSYYWLDSRFAKTKGSMLLPGMTKSKNILILSSQLNIEQYRTLFVYSFAVLIAYSERFKYRVSNVLNECISNNKLCFISDITSLKYYSKYIKYLYYFSLDVEELIHCISDALDKDIEINPDKYVSTNELLCDFSELWKQ